jgi:hypothetical protein
MERAKGGGVALPIDQAGEAHERATTVDKVHEGGAEELRLPA